MRLAWLHTLGLRTWDEIVEHAERIPRQYREALVVECRSCQEALAQGNIQHFVDRFESHDKWRILAHFFDDTSYFDIETTGLEYDSRITVIACWHRGQMHTFVEHDNLDDFLDLLDEVALLASFNGSSFDVPRIVSTFHIPELPCPHLDLRWPCFHRGLRGSLKRVAEQIGIVRPVDLQDADGHLAVQLWDCWVHRQDERARDQLIRYCAADVLLLMMVAHHIANRDNLSLDDLWAQLPKADPLSMSTPTTRITARADARRSVAALFGAGAPAKLRALR